jgi:hypothetical protein
MDHPNFKNYYTIFTGQFTSLLHTKGFLRTTQEKDEFLPI